MADKVKKTIYILGAGFSAAFGGIPVMNRFLDGSEEQLQKYPETRKFIADHGFDLATANIETLLTLAAIPKPWIAPDDAGRFAIVAEQLKKLVLEIIETRCPKAANAELLQYHLQRRDGNKPKRPFGFQMGIDRQRALDAFARHLLAEQGACRAISFNYDILLENAVELAQLALQPDSYNFHTGVSYGFQANKVNPNGRIEAYRRAPSPQDLIILKMHGSSNWRLRKGHGPPFSQRDMVVLSCHDDHLDDNAVALEAMDVELDDTPFIVPPVMDKAAMMDHPVIKILWSRAGKEIERAARLVFIGYSFPPTDYYSEFLFRNHAREKEKSVQVISVPQQEQQTEFEGRYTSILGANVEFCYCGAVSYCEDMFAAE